MNLQQAVSSHCVMNVMASHCSYLQTALSKGTGQGDYRGAAQFFWRPAQAVAEVAEAGVVTSKGKLLFARVGHQLESHRESSADVVSCAAWSDDGSMLAVATGHRIIIAAPEANDAIFRVAVRLPVSRPSTPVVAVIRSHGCVNCNAAPHSIHTCVPYCHSTGNR